MGAFMYDNGFSFTPYGFSTGRKFYDSPFHADDRLTVATNSGFLGAPDVTMRVIGDAHAPDLSAPAQFLFPEASQDATRTVAFDAIDFNQNGSNTGFLSIPPDPIGAVSDSHLVNVVNRSIEWYTKDGVLQNSQSLESFFPGQELTGPESRNFFDPKVIYDPFADRFIVVVLSFSGRDTNTSLDNASRVHVSVSDDGDPNGVWFNAFFDGAATIGGTEGWSDYPGIGVTEDSVFITNNIFEFEQTSTGDPEATNFLDARFWILDKGIGTDGFYDGGTLDVSNALDPNGTRIQGTTQPATVLDEGGDDETFLVSTLIFEGEDFLQIDRIDETLTGAFQTEFISLGDVSVPALSNAPQAGTTDLIETNDTRALNAVVQDGILYTVFTSQPETGPEAGETAAHWATIDITGPATLIDQGTIGGDDIAPGTFVYFPSIAVNDEGTIGIGFSASSPTTFGGAYFAYRFADDPAGTISESLIVREGEGPYIRTFGGDRNRWGDYSGTVVDPEDDTTFWVYNEYAQVPGSPVTDGENGLWGTAWAAFSFDAGTSDNTVPIAQDDAFSTDEGATLIGDLYADNGAGQDIDPDGDPLIVTAVNGDVANIDRTVTLTSGAELGVSSLGLFRYDPNGAFDDLNDGESVTEIFTYTVSDGALSTDATVAIIVTGSGTGSGGNLPPVVQDDLFEAVADFATDGNLLLNNGSGPDLDPDGGFLSVSAVNGNAGAVGGTITLPSGARLTVQEDGSFSYDPDTAFDDLQSGDTATDSFTYAVSDGQGGSATATASVQLFGTSDSATNGPDVLAGTEVNDFINGLGGDDRIFTGPGNDFLVGSDGDDALFGGAGTDTLFSGNGDDALFGGAGNDFLDGGSGADTLTGGPGTDRLQGGSGGDLYPTGFGNSDNFIRDFSIAQDEIDAIVFDAGITPDGVTIAQGGSANTDLILTFGPGVEDQVTAERHFEASGFLTIEEVRFADGTVWTDEFIAMEAAAAAVAVAASEPVTAFDAGPSPLAVIAPPAVTTQAPEPFAGVERELDVFSGPSRFLDLDTGSAGEVWI